MENFVIVAMIFTDHWFSQIKKLLKVLLTHINSVQHLLVGLLQELQIDHNDDDGDEIRH